MIRTFLFTVLLSSTAFAQSFQLPAQQSAVVVRSVVNLILADEGLKFSKINKITVSDDFSSAKAELIDQEGNCVAIPYVIKMNQLGENEVKVNTLALAICN